MKNSTPTTEAFSTGTAGTALKVLINRLIDQTTQPYFAEFVTTWEFWYDFFGEWKEDSDLEAECINNGGGPGTGGTNPPPGEVG